MANDSMKRQTAVKIRISDINESRYVKATGEWEPNYLLTPYKTRVSRVNIVGSVIDSDANNFTIDDGSGKLSVRSFEELTYKPPLGEVIILIGRPREFSNEIYVVPEIIRPITKNKEKWIELRVLELKRLYDGKAREVPTEHPETESEPQIQEEPAQKTEVAEEKIEDEQPKENGESKNIFDEVIKTIKATDQGDGADMEEIIEKTGFDEKDVENVINNLLMDGEAFEIRPGRLKLLD